MIIEFGGWFQVRMASDPDPTDERRGISGCTFALPGEPDLDRIIRMQNPGTIPRSFGPSVGVNVTGVSGGVSDQTKQCLLGARVALADDAKFVEQNGAVVPRNTAFIDPFDLRIYGEDDENTLLRRKAVWDVSRPYESYYGVASSLLKYRQPKLEINCPEVLERSGVDNVEQYWARRRSNLQVEYDQAQAHESQDLVLLSGLEQRIDNLNLNDWRNVRLNTLLAARASYGFELQELASSTTIAGELQPEISAEEYWRTEFWMGAWDNDALCGYVYGELHVP